MERLVGEDSENTNIIRPKFFERNIDVMFAAALIGFRQHKLGEAETSADAKKTILNEQILKNSSTIQFIYRTIVLLDNSIENSSEEKLKIAFAESTTSHDTSKITTDEQSEKYEKLFYNYILGGIEYLYDNLINNGESNPIENIRTIIEDFDV